MAKGYWVALVNVKNKEEYQKALSFLMMIIWRKLFILLID